MEGPQELNPFMQTEEDDPLRTLWKPDVNNTFESESSKL